MKAPSRLEYKLTQLRQRQARRNAKATALQAQHVAEEKARTEARRTQDPLAFWMRRELASNPNEETALDNWRMLVQMPPGVWQRTWDAFGHGTARYSAELLEGQAHLIVTLPHMKELWWEINITAWGTTLAFKNGQDYPEMLRQCLGEAIERVEGAHDHLMHDHGRAKLTKTLREGEQLIQAWIARYALKEQT